MANDSIVSARGWLPSVSDPPVRDAPGGRRRMSRFSRLLVGATVVVLAVSLAEAPAWARPAHCFKSGCVPASNLRWTSPANVTDGVPVQDATISPCPDSRPDGSPIQGTRQVFVTVLFSLGGGMTQGPVAVSSDGGWSGSLTFNASGNRDPNATVFATCEDVTNGSVILGSYRTQDTSVNS